MEIKTIAVHGRLHVSVDLASLCSLENYRLTFSKGILKLGRLTVSIYRTGKVKIYGIKQESDIPQVWNELLRKLSMYIDVSNADRLPKLKFMLDVEKHPFTLDQIKIKSAFADEKKRI